jgi:predicted nucleic acid-binding protein
VILIDTSAWVEFLRGTGSTACERVDALLAEEFAVCHPVRMEVLAGARDERHLAQLRGLLARGTLLPTHQTHYEEASALFRTCRRRGETVRKLIDCLIAATTISASARILHCDSDFDVLARHTPLLVATV